MRIILFSSFHFAIFDVISTMRRVKRISPVGIGEPKRSRAMPVDFEANGEIQATAARKFFVT